MDSRQPKPIPRWRELLAQGNTITGLKMLAREQLKKHGHKVATERHSHARKIFEELWDSEFSKVLETAPVERRGALANAKGVYKGRTLRFVCIEARRTGAFMTQQQSAAADKLIAKYDSNRARKSQDTKANKAWDYKTRVGDEVSALYTFHLQTEDFGSISAAKVASIGRAFETVLRLVDVDPREIAAELDK